MDTQNLTATDASVPELDFSEPPAGSDRRAFMMRSAMVMAIVAARRPRVNPLFAQVPADAAASRASRSIRTCNVVKKSKGPVMTLVDEFYKVGPGPSSSHTIGPMRITYDFYQRAIQAAGRRNSPRRPRSRFICSAASARPARAMARSARRWPGLIGT